MRKPSRLEMMRRSRDEREKYLVQPLAQENHRLRNQLQRNLIELDQHKMEIDGLNAALSTDIGKFTVETIRHELAMKYEPELRRVLDASGPVQVVFDAQEIRFAKHPLPAMLSKALSEMERRARFSTVRIDEAKAVSIRVTIPAITIAHDMLVEDTEETAHGHR